MLWGERITMGLFKEERKKHLSLTGIGCTAVVHGLGKGEATLEMGDLRVALKVIPLPSHPIPSGQVQIFLFSDRSITSRWGLMCD